MSPQGQESCAPHASALALGMPQPLRFRPAAGAAALMPLLLSLLAACGKADAKAAGGTRADRAAAATAPAVRDTGDADLVAKADQGRILGSEQAMWVVMISDFQCPYCKQWHDQAMANRWS